MILLTGATGIIGRALLRRLTGSGAQVRCLVRDPRGLGSDRVRVQIALGDLADPASFRNALRGVDTVLHLAASIGDQQKASVEELNAVATLRLVRAAERAGARRFAFFSALGASLQSPSRFLRAKALARQAVESADLETTVFSPSIAYTPGDSWLTTLTRLSYLPVMPVIGTGDAVWQPIWAEDVADCVMAAADWPDAAQRRSFELAGPEPLSHDDMVRLALRAEGRERSLLHFPRPIVKAALRGIERIAGPAAAPNWTEAELLDEPMVSHAGTADAESLGVTPKRMGAVLGAA